MTALGRTTGKRASNLQHALEMGALAVLAILFATDAAAGESDGSSALVQVQVTSGTDSDDDGLIDTVEAGFGTDPAKADSDGDSLPDSYEVWNSLDPLNFSDGEADVDEDGLSSQEEYEAGTLPFERDSDGDGFWDAFELSKGSDAMAQDSYPSGGAKEDVNCDGSVDAVDIQMVINAVLGLEMPVPVNVNETAGADSTDVQTVINAVVR